MLKIQEVTFSEAVKHPRKGMGLERFFSRVGTPLDIWFEAGLVHVALDGAPTTLSPIANVRYMIEWSPPKEEPETDPQSPQAKKK